MIDEHALEVEFPISIEELNYLIKKANRLGMSNREISGVYEVKDGVRTHIYFRADGLEVMQLRRKFA